MPGIIAFLGYNPLPDAKTLGERLVRHRTTLGMSQKEVAEEIGVDQETLARWERERGSWRARSCTPRRGFSWATERRRSARGTRQLR